MIPEDTDDAITERLPVLTGTPPRRRRRPSVLAGFTGVLTAALVLLALTVVAAEVLSLLHGDPGPGAWLVVLHVLAALLAVAAQRRVDGPGPRLLPALVVLGVAVAVGAFLWWAWLWLFWSF